MPARTATWATIALSSSSAPKRSASARPTGTPAAPNWREMVITGISRSSRGRSQPRHGVDELAHRRGRLIEGGLLVGGQLDLDDRCDAHPTELDRHAHEEPIHAVLALEVSRAGQDLVPITQDRVDHLGDACPPLLITSPP